MMPEKRTMGRAEEDLREDKSPSAAAGEFVREEVEHVREGKHGARSPQQAIATGLSKARRAGVPLKPPARGKTSETARQKAEKDYQQGQSGPQTSGEKTTRGRAREKALRKEPKSSANHEALSHHAKSVARKRRSS